MIFKQEKKILMKDSLENRDLEIKFLVNIGSKVQ